MKLNYKNRQFIINLCEECSSYSQASKIVEALTTLAEQKRIKKIVQDVLLGFKSMCLCEVVGSDRKTQYQKLAQELAFNFIKVVDESE